MQFIINRMQHLATPFLEKSHAISELYDYLPRCDLGKTTATKTNLPYSSEQLRRALFAATFWQYTKQGRGETKQNRITPKATLYVVLTDIKRSEKNPLS